MVLFELFEKLDTQKTGLISAHEVAQAQATLRVTGKVCPLN